MIGDAILWTVVGANLFTPVASADQRLARNGVCAALSLLFGGEGRVALGEGVVLELQREPEEAGRKQE